MNIHIFGYNYFFNFLPDLLYSAPIIGLVSLCQNVRHVKFINGVFIFQMISSLFIIVINLLFMFSL